MPRKKIIGWCAIEGCQRPLSSKGLCQYHYNIKRIEDNPRKADRHPFYHLWFERKQNNLLCAEWLNFENFVIGVGAKPEGEFFLVRPNEGPFSPTNFKWEEHLRRRPDEAAKDWYARKLASRKAAYPNLDSDRNIKRQYGLTRETYNEISQSQNYVCAICKKFETALDGKSNSFKKLAVDHCHTTQKIRGLLCWRCNTTIGRIGEDLELVDNIKAYLIKHLD